MPTSKKPSNAKTKKNETGTEASDSELQQRIGMAVKLARTSRGLTQRQLANRIGKSQNFIYTLEKGVSDPGIVALFRIAQILKVSLNLFVPTVESQDVHELIKLLSNMPTSDGPVKRNQRSAKAGDFA